MPAVARIDPKDVFTPEEWTRFSKRSSWLGLVCVAGAWGLIFAAGAMFALWPNPLTYILAVMLIGARQLGLAILMHDAAHGALHSNLKVNDWVGEWLCAAPVGARLESYRDYHLKHHRFTEQPEDPDLALSAPFPITRKSLWRKIVRDLTGQTFLKQRTRAIVRQPQSPAKSSTASNGALPARERAAARGPHALLAIGGPTSRSGSCRWRRGCRWSRACATSPSTRASTPRTIRSRTRARRSPTFVERLFIAPYWVHFHGEHHVFMHVPCYRLERLHKSLMDKGYWSRMHIAPGYVSVLRRGDE